MQVQVDQEVIKEDIWIIEKRFLHKFAQQTKELYHETFFSRFSDNLSPPLVRVNDILQDDLNNLAIRLLIR